jgi:hypothetical protein
MKPREAARQPAAGEEVAERLLDKARQALALDVFVDRNTRTLSLPVLYRNADFVVYDLR